MRVFCCQSRASRVPIHVSGVCYAEPYTVPGLRMRSRYLVCITLLAVCHPSVRAQAAPLLINAAPLAKKHPSSTAGPSHAAPAALFDQNTNQLPIAVPEPQPSTGVPVQIEALTQTRAGELWTLAGNVVIHYRSYV